jgi:hypothetical protein
MELSFNHEGAEGAEGKSFFSIVPFVYLRRLPRLCGLDVCF